MKDAAGETNMLHTDDTNGELSEFEYIDAAFPEGRETSDLQLVDNNRYASYKLGCTNINNDRTDAYDNNCAAYIGGSYCGLFDTRPFSSKDMCCSCGGGCFDSDEGKQDSNGYGCEYYSALPHECGNHDTTDFTAKSLCCACDVFE